MLNGIDPIIIFQFKKISKETQEKLSKIPLVSSIVDTIGLPPIPIYLSEQVTGLYIDSEDRNIDIETTVDSLYSGASPLVSQKAINSVVRINMIGSRNSIGLTLITALADLIVPKVGSKEYAITYLHGGTTVFGGLLHSFSAQQNANNELVNITIELTKNSTAKPAGPPVVAPTTEGVTLSGGVNAIPPTAPVSAGASGASSVLSGPPTPAAAPAPVQLNGLR